MPMGSLVRSRTPETKNGKTTTDQQCYCGREKIRKKGEEGKEECRWCTRRPLGRPRLTSHWRDGHLLDRAPAQSGSVPDLKTALCGTTVISPANQALRLLDMPGDQDEQLHLGSAGKLGKWPTGAATPRPQSLSLQSLRLSGLYGPPGHEPGDWRGGPRGGLGVKTGQACARVLGASTRHGGD